jgi:hypothetical protein
MDVGLNRTEERLECLIRICSKDFGKICASIFESGDRAEWRLGKGRDVNGVLCIWVHMCV